MRSSEEPKGRALYFGANSHYICPETAPVLAPFCAPSFDLSSASSRQTVYALFPRLESS